MAATFQQRVLKLLKQIDDGGYPAQLLEDIDQLRRKVKADTESVYDDEGMAMLGYLLKKKYVFIHDNKGIKLTEDSILSKTLREMVGSIEEK